MGGMAAWMRAEGYALDSAATLVLGLDTVGSGEPVVLDAEGGLWPVRYRERRRGARRACGGAAGVRCGAGASGRGPIPCSPRLGGLPALSLLSVREGGFPNYHLPSDTPERVDYGCLEASVNASLAIARAHAA